MSFLRSHRPRPWAVRAALGDLVVWALPVFVIWAIYLSPRHVLSPETALAGLVGLAVLVLASRRPAASLIILIAVFPFQALILAKLWTWGMPTSIVRHLGAWKELLALGVIVAGVRSLLSSGRRLDTLDRLALGFVALVGLYALLQPQIIPGAPAASSARLLGFRETAGFALVLFGARHAPLGPDFAGRAGRALLAVGGIVAGIGVFEAVDSGGWNHFVVHTIGYPRYEIGVLNAHVSNPNDIRIYGTVGGARIDRIGSTFVNELNLAFWLVLPFAVGFERIVRRSATPWVLMATLLTGAALLLTQTRSAILGGVIVAFLAVRPAAGRPSHWRTQAAIVLAGLALVAVPAAFSTGFAKRVGATNTASDSSSAGHLSGFTQGISSLGAHPLGRGLATSAGTGQRLTVSNVVIPENSYLDVGVELGVLPMALFMALTVALIVALRRAARTVRDPAITAVWAAGLALAIGALFLQTWLSFEVAWTYWGIGGAMLGVARERARVHAMANAVTEEHQRVAPALTLQSAASSLGR